MIAHLIILFEEIKNCIRSKCTEANKMLSNQEKNEYQTKISFKKKKKKQTQKDKRQ